MRKFIRLIESVEMVTLYHGTCAESAEALCTNGWAPNSGSQGGNMGQAKYLYLTTLAENARWFANEKGCNSILLVTVPKAWLIVDPEDGVGETVDEEFAHALKTGLPGNFGLAHAADADCFQPALINESWYDEIMEHSLPGLTDADRAAICKQMVEAELRGDYWDDRAVAAYPGKFSGTDNAIDMIQAWRDGYYKMPFPEKFKDMESVDIMTTPEFRVFIEDWAKARLSQVEEKLAAVPTKRGGYLIHRIIRVPSQWLEKVRKDGTTSLGLHWTYDVDGWESEIGIYPVWADENMNGIDLLFSTIIRPNEVDWKYTVLSNMDWYSGDREFEMRPIKGTRLRYITCENPESGKRIDVSGIVFYA
jgi:hypothetical protein